MLEHLDFFLHTVSETCINFTVKPKTIIFNTESVQCMNI